VPASPWLSTRSPQRPVFAAPHGPYFSWAAASGDRPWLWVFQFRQGALWHTMILNEPAVTLDGPAPDAIAVSEVDRNGMAGPSAGMELRTVSPAEAGSKLPPAHRGTN
jgi:hypothetical protein